uniref:Uncharacterized protein n=1 Tax=Rhizophora mucronata TaxID=61149 RepID=A0A2P2PTC6_RHIMU
MHYTMFHFMHHTATLKVYHVIWSSF